MKSKQLKPAEAAWRSLVGLRHSSLLPGPFPDATRVWKGCKLSADEESALLEKPRAQWCPLTWHHGTVTWCPLPLGPRNSSHTSQPGSQLERQRTHLRSGNLLRQGTDVMWQWGVPYLSEPWDCRRGYFWKLGWDLLLQTKKKSKWALWFKAAFYWSASLGILKIDTPHLHLLSWGLGFVSAHGFLEIIVETQSDITGASV